MVPLIQASQRSTSTLSALVKTVGKSFSTPSHIQHSLRSLSSVFATHASGLASQRLYSVDKRLSSLPITYLAHLRTPLFCRYASHLETSHRKHVNPSPKRVPVNFPYTTKVCYSKTAHKNGHGRLISFDYAIKFLLKNKENYSVVESFISAVLEQVGYPKVKIVQVRDPENQKTLKSDKKTIPDIVVEDEAGKYYLIEVERNHYSNAVYKATYNSSHSVVYDHIDSDNDEFHNISKVIHISILYTNYGDVDDYLYHGKIEPKGVNNQSRLAIYRHDNHQKYNTIEDLPEYFFVFPDNFHETFKDKFDEWMHALKHGDVREEALEKFSDLRDAAQRMSYLNFTDEEREIYNAAMAERAKQITQLRDSEMLGREKGIEIGREEGIEIGREENKKDIVLKMLEEQLTIDQITKITGFSVEEVQSLKDATFTNT